VTTKPLKILIMRLSALGDIVNLTVIFSKIREKYPDAEIHFVTKKQFQSIIESNNHNINVITYDSKTGLSGWRNLCCQLQGENFDYFLDMHNNIRSRILTFYLKNVKTKKFVKPRIKRFFLFYLLLNFFPKSFDLISEYLKVLKLIGIDADQGETDILLQDSVKVEADKVLADFGIEKEFVVILPIAAWKNKLYSLDNYKKVSEMIVNKNNLQVIWLGGKSDEYLQNVEFENKDIIKIIGQTSLMVSMAILQRAKVVIGNDTGLTYAAQALGTPALIIEGPTSRETGAGHIQFGSKVLEKELWCRPCSQKGDRKCYHKKQYCLDFSVDEVYEMFNSIRR